MTVTPTVAAKDERYAYLLKTETQVRRRVQAVQRQYGISYNDALNILLREALDARSIPQDS
jgi:antitoxin component of RelBE/YafQ-DinJ toxin-antitoxin module